MYDTYIFFFLNQKKQNLCMIHLLDQKKQKPQRYYKNIIDNFLQQDMQTKYDKPKVTKPQTKK
jgi:hypothetical protein